jgi:phosphoglycerate dehydrogenase-like enzyme
MPTVLISPEAYLNQDLPHVPVLREAGFDIRYPRDPLFTRGFASVEETIAELRGAAAVLAGGEVISAGVLAGVPELRVVARAGVGYDRVDVPACTKHGVAVTITPTANHESVAEHALALLLAVAKNVLRGDRATRACQWPRTPGMPVRGTTLGIVGLGRIGRSLAVRAKALGMRVVATEMAPDRSFCAQHGVELLELDALLAESDYVSLHCPSLPETRGLMNRERLARMKRGSVLINTARGELVVERDLAAALDSGHLAGAGLDVLEREPPQPGDPMLSRDDVVLTPHIAGSDTRSSADMGLEAARCIVALAGGKWPEGAVVNAELKGRFRW